MTPSEFQRATKELLQDTWGEKAYLPGVIQKLWGIVGGISVQEFKIGLEQLSLTCSRAPALGQIRGACLPAIQKAAQTQTEAKIRRMEESGLLCPLCNNGGYVWVIPYDNPCAEGVFLCTCEAAKVRGFLPNHGLSYWDPALEHGFYVRRFTGPSWLEAEKLQRDAFAKLHGGKAPVHQKEKTRLQTQKAELTKIKAQLEAGEITGTEALALVELAKQPQEETRAVPTVSQPGPKERPSETIAPADRPHAPAQEPARREAQAPSPEVWGDDIPGIEDLPW